jgi:predicted esterase YcpF (UPF0227 family)
VCLWGVRKGDEVKDGRQICNEATNSNEETVCEEEEDHCYSEEAFHSL